MSLANPVNVDEADTVIVRLVTDDYKKALQLVKKYDPLVLNGYKVYKIRLGEFAEVAEAIGVFEDNNVHLTAAYTAVDGGLIVQPNNAEQIYPVLLR